VASLLRKYLADVVSKMLSKLSKCKNIGQILELKFFIKILFQMFSDLSEYNSLSTFLENDTPINRECSTKKTILVILMQLKDKF